MITMDGQVVFLGESSLMPELQISQKEALELFISSADRLEMAVTGLSDQALDFSSAPDEWTIRQIVCHLASDGDAWSMPFQTAIATPGATIQFGGFPCNEVWADVLVFDERPVNTAVMHIKSHRRLISELAEHFPDAWGTICGLQRFSGTRAAEGKRGSNHPHVR